MANHCLFQAGTGALLLASTGYLLAVQPDWWIYGIVVAVAGFTNLLYCPENVLWRFAASLVIVLGTLEAVFLAWTFKTLDQAPLLNETSQSTYPILNEGRNIFIVAAATSLTISSRFRSFNLSLRNVFRGLLLLAFLALSALSAAYSLRFIVPDAVTHALIAISQK